MLPHGPRFSSLGSPGGQFLHPKMGKRRKWILVGIEGASLGLTQGRLVLPIRAGLSCTSFCKFGEKTHILTLRRRVKDGCLFADLI